MKMTFAEHEREPGRDERQRHQATAPERTQHREVQPDRQQRPSPPSRRRRPRRCSGRSTSVQHEADVGGERQVLPVGEVRHALDAEDQRGADAREGQDGAGDEAVEGELEQVGEHQGQAAQRPAVAPVAAPGRTRVAYPPGTRSGDRPDGAGRMAGPGRLRLERDRLDRRAGAVRLDLPDVVGRASSTRPSLVNWMGPVAPLKWIRCPSRTAPIALSSSWKAERLAGRVRHRHDVLR